MEQKKYYGRFNSLEAFEAWRKRIVEYTRTPESRKKMADAHRGIPRPDWVKQKISEGLRRVKEAQKV